MTELPPTQNEQRDRTGGIARELGRLVRLRDDLDQPASLDNILVQERLRRLADRISAVEDELSYELASSLPGALG